MQNTVTLVGFVGDTPEVRTAQSGAAITNLSLATTRSFKDGDGARQTETECHRITCFNGVGKCVAQLVTKGAMVMVTGRIRYSRWTDSEGNHEQRRGAARGPDSRCRADDRDRPVKTLRVDCLRRPGNDQDRQVHTGDGRCAQSPSGQGTGRQL